MMELVKKLKEALRILIQTSRIRALFTFSPFIVTFWWTVIVLFLCETLWMNVLEFRTHDLRFQWRGPTAPNEQIVFIAIDDRSILKDEEFDEDYVKKNPGIEMLQKYPYPRKVFAHVIEKLVKCDVGVVVLDLLFENESVYGPEDDKALREVLEKYPNKVVIGANYYEKVLVKGAETAAGTTKVPIPHQSILPKNVSYKEVVGFVNLVFEVDGVIRHLEPVGLWRAEEEGGQIMAELMPPYSIDGLGVKKAAPHVSLPPLYEKRLIKYAGWLNNEDREIYEPHPLYLLFYGKTWNEDRPPFQQGKFFKDKIVLIGPHSNFMHDQHRTPFGVIDGPIIHLNAIATLLDPQPLKAPPLWLGIIIVAVVGNLFALILPLAKSPLAKLIPACIFGLGYLGIAQFAFIKFSIFLPLAPIEILIVGSTASVVTLQAVFELLEKRRVSGMLQRYVSKNVADELIKSGQDVGNLLAPQKRTVTILFSDVRNFTTMTEENEPGPFVQQLNEYLTSMVECVFNNKGTLDKFVGDAVMAVFGNPKSFGKEQDAWFAVKTAIEMRQRLAELNARWIKEGKPIFQFGIGLNHGEVMAGDIGSSQKAEFGVIGDSVNVAARVESLTKEQKVDLLITDSVYQLVKDKVEVEHRGDIKVKGRGKAVDVYALKGLKDTGHDSVVMLRKAMAYSAPVTSKKLDS